MGNNFLQNDGRTTQFVILDLPLHSLPAALLSENRSALGDQFSVAPSTITHL